MPKHTNSFMHYNALARRHPSAFLLAAQFLSLVLYAVVNQSSSGRVLLGAVGVLILTLVVWVINRSPAIRWIAWVLVAPAIISSLLSLVSPNPGLQVMSSLLEAGLYFYAAGSLIAYMMKDFRVTLDELFAAGATFTLLAWGFAYLYLVCLIWLPDSFMGGSRPQTFIELLFLSFTNLSATGISDLLPVSPPARVLAMLEQFAGVGYVAVVVSRLIGMTIVRYEEKRSP